MKTTFFFILIEVDFRPPLAHKIPYSLRLRHRLTINFYVIDNHRGENSIAEILQPALLLASFDLYKHLAGLSVHQTIARWAEIV